MYQLLKILRQRNFVCFIVMFIHLSFIVLLTGGGVPESKRATELSKLLGLGLPILPSQVITG